MDSNDLLQYTEGTHFYINTYIEKELHTWKHTLIKKNNIFFSLLLNCTPGKDQADMRCWRMDMSELLHLQFIIQYSNQ